MRIVAFADTHTLHNRITVPDGDVLICAGDFCSTGNIEQLKRFKNWFLKLPHKYKIIVAGNHDRICEQVSSAELDKLFSPAIYLEDQTIIIEGINFYGTPVQPMFNNWAFNRSGSDLDMYYKMIPSDTDVLITHCPPYSIMDQAHGRSVGSQELLNHVHRVNPALHIFGHIHEGRGVQVNDKTTFVNATICDGIYEPIYAPVVLEIDSNRVVFEC
jgi:Icc-related predicted phosphoesterase